MADREAKIEQLFTRRMRDHGYMSFKADASAEKQTGWMDRMYFGPGGDVRFVEFKREKAPKKRKGEKLQNHIRKQLVKRGFRCYRVEGMVEAAMVFRGITGDFL